MPISLWNYLYSCQSLLLRAKRCKEEDAYLNVKPYCIYPSSCPTPCACSRASSAAKAFMIIFWSSYSELACCTQAVVAFSHQDRSSRHEPRRKDPSVQPCVMSPCIESKPRRLPYLLRRLGIRVTPAAAACAANPGWLRSDCRIQGLPQPWPPEPTDLRQTAAFNIPCKSCTMP